MSFIHDYLQIPQSILLEFNIYFDEAIQQKIDNYLNFK